jgi:hypothetical protein
LTRIRQDVNNPAPPLVNAESRRNSIGRLSLHFPEEKWGAITYVRRSNYACEGSTGFDATDEVAEVIAASRTPSAAVRAASSVAIPLIREITTG